MGKTGPVRVLSLWFRYPITASLAHDLVQNPKLVFDSIIPSRSVSRASEFHLRGKLPYLEMVFGNWPLFLSEDFHITRVENVWAMQLPTT